MNIHTQTIIGAFAGVLIGLSVSAASENFEAGLMTIKPRVLVDSCLTQGNGSEACRGCLKNSCRNQTKTGALQECLVSCSGEPKLHGSAADRCTAQGNGSESCNTCLKNACRSASTEYSAVICERSCKTGSEGEDPTCLQQGNGGVRCATCLEDRCTRHSTSQSLYLCRYRCL